MNLLAVSNLAPRLDRPREVKKLLATLFTTPGNVRVSSRAVTVRLMTAVTQPERDAFRAFLRDVTRMRLSLPREPDCRRLRWRAHLNDPLQANWRAGLGTTLVAPWIGVLFGEIPRFVALVPASCIDRVRQSARRVF